MGQRSESVIPSWDARHTCRLDSGSNKAHRALTEAQLADHDSQPCAASPLARNAGLCPRAGE